MKVLAITLALLPIGPSHVGAEIANAPTTQSVQQSAETGKKALMSVHKGVLKTTIEAQGYFEPIDPFDVRIRPKVYSGELTIKSISPHGAKVKQGDVILEIDPATIDKQLAVAENEAAVAHANLSKIQVDRKVGREQDELSLNRLTVAAQRAKEDVAWFEKTDGPNILLETETSVKNAKANVEDQQDEVNELKKMYKSDDLTTATSEIVVKRALRNLEVLKINSKINQDHADKVVKMTYPARKEQVLEAAKQAELALESFNAALVLGNANWESSLATAAANSKAADEKLADLKVDKQKLTITAPANGVILYGQLTAGAFQGADEKSLKVGEKIGAQQAVMTFYTPGKLRLHVELPEPRYFSIPAGAKGTIVPVAWPEKTSDAKCQIHPAIAMVSQQGPQYHLLVDCPKLDTKLVPGMRATLKVQTPDGEPSILVPNSAIADNAVWVKGDEGKPEKRTVVAGKSDGHQTQIKQGLSEGEDIFVEAQK